VVTAEEIEQAVERLKKAGLWAHSNNFVEELTKHAVQIHLISGSDSPPEFFTLNGIEGRRLSGNSFNVIFDEKATIYAAAFRLQQVNLTVRKSDNFEDVVAAMTSYAELHSRMQAGPYSILRAVFALKQAGLAVSLLDQAVIEAKDKLHTFVIRWTQSKWSVQIDNGNKLPSVSVNTLVEAVMKVIDFYDIA
jgi:hypothetical protein